MTFEVHLEVFEGPLDLLLQLVRRDDLDINTVSLARVTDQFLSHLRRLEEIDIGALAAFCETAAALIVIKSRLLLPRGRAPSESAEDDPDELAARLLAYKRYREVAEQLGHRERRGLRAYVRTAPAPADLPPRLDPGDVGPEDLAAAFRKALEAVRDSPEEAASDEAIRPYTVRISDRLHAIRGRLREHRRVSFLEVLIEGPKTREFVIVTFLAVLELLRRRAVRVVQGGLFEEIMIEARDIDAMADSAVGDESFLDEV